jgi:hypothetical protein
LEPLLSCCPLTLSRLGYGRSSCPLFGGRCPGTEWLPGPGWRLGGSQQQPGGRCCCKACPGGAHVMKPGIAGGGWRLSGGFFFFFFFSFKEFAESASPPFAVWARPQEDRGEQGVLGPRGRCLRAPVPVPADPRGVNPAARSGRAPGSHGRRQLHRAAEPRAATGGERHAGRSRAQRWRPRGGGDTGHGRGPRHRHCGPGHQGTGALGHLLWGGWGGGD